MDARFHIETAHWLTGSERHAIRLGGWFFDPALNANVAIFSAWCEGAQIAACAPIERRDVQGHFGDTAKALRSGFALGLPPIVPAGTIELGAILDSNDVVIFWRAAAEDLPGRGPVHCRYASWANAVDPDPAPATLQQPATTFSILMPVYNTRKSDLEEAVTGVLNQHLRNWELVVVDDASSLPHIASTLTDFGRRDPRIRLLRHNARRGIARATNTALSHATGEFVVMLDHDDILRPHALAELANSIARAPAVDVLYSDEDKLDPAGQRCFPMLKPAYSPEFLRGVMYIGHVLAVRTNLAREIGGFDPYYDGIQDYEFVLRVTERTRRIRHVPRILYHWRQSPASSALQGNIKGDMDQRQAEAVNAHLRRTGQPRRARAIGGHRVLVEPDPSSEAPDILQHMYGPETELAGCLLKLVQARAAKVLVLRGEGLPEIGQNDARALADLALVEDAGVVAPIWLDEHGRVHESGLTTTGSEFVPMMRGFDRDGDGYNGTLRCHREVLAVSPRLFAVAVDALAAMDLPDQVGWFDLLSQLRERGRFHRVCASVRLHRGPSHGNSRVQTPACAGGVDPFLNPHFDPQNGDYAFAARPRHIGSVGQTTGDSRQAEASSIVFHVESPIDERIRSAGLICRGWAFVRENRPLTGVRLRHPKIGPIPGAIGLPRLDVRATHPEASDKAAGWEVRTRLPTGSHQLVLEFEVAAGAWIPTAVVSARMRPSRLPSWTPWHDASDLLRFQFPAHPAYAPQLLQAEQFPQDRLTAINMPKISVVTPSYQQAWTLGRCMDSVIANRDMPLEYFVQDGGSSDGSVAEIRTRANLISGWSTGPDGGQSQALAKGFAKTSGKPTDLMAWINSDDFYMPGALRFVSEYFARHPEVDVVYGHRVVVNREGQEIARWYLPKHDPEVLRLNDFVPQETMFWRRRIWDKVGGIDTSFQFAMDWDLLLRFQEAGAKIVRLPYFLACFRVHPQQKTSALISTQGQAEIDALRRRTFGRDITPDDLLNSKPLQRYLRKSAWIEQLWKWGIRAK